MIKVELEFHSVPEAIIALNAIMNLPEVKATAVVDAKAPRRGRADKGQKRGEYKPREAEPATPGPAAAQAQEAQRAEPPVQVAVAPAEVVKAEHAPVPATIGDKDVDAQKAMEALHGKKGLDACRVLLGQFGVSRIREIPTARRAEFLEKAKRAAV